MSGPKTLRGHRFYPDGKNGDDATSSDALTAADGEIIPGSSQADAVLVPLGTKVFGTIHDKAYAWFAFTTEEISNATYHITIVNETVSSDTLYGVLCDEYGTELGSAGADSDGAPATLSIDSLEPNTTYYVRLNPRIDDTLDYSVIIKNPDSKTTAYQTNDVFSHTIGAQATENSTVTAGTNVNDAVLLPFSTKVRGTVEEDRRAWFGFTTGEDTGDYKITIVNATPDSDWLYGTVYDEYGTDMGLVMSEKNPGTISVDSLEPNTTYYISLFSRLGKKMDYTLMIESPEKEEEKQNELIFEVPFEINETQVQFVGDQAVFVDEAKAKEVLKPVAEAILAHPDHAILIAGTTATLGPEESSIELSQQRALAVKNLLIDTYGVPESQIHTVGLGYSKDPFERGRDVDSNGNLIESEARKNRRVVVLDAADPIAQEIIKK